MDLQHSKSLALVVHCDGSAVPQSIDGIFPLVSLSTPCSPALDFCLVYSFHKSIMYITRPKQHVLFNFFMFSFPLWFLQSKKKKKHPLYAQSYSTYGAITHVFIDPVSTTRVMASTLRRLLSLSQGVFLVPIPSLGWVDLASQAQKRRPREVPEIVQPTSQPNNYATSQPASQPTN